MPTERDLVVDTIVVETPGRFPSKVEEAIQAMLYCDSTEQYEPIDSGSCKVYDIGSRLDSFQTYLVEERMVCPGGSCGYNIFVVQYRGDSIVDLFHECGSVDSVLPIMHNGLFDFSIQFRSYHRGEPLHYRWTGDSFTSYEDPSPQNEPVLIRNALAKVDDAYDFDQHPLRYHHILLGSSCRTVIVHDMTEKYLLFECQAGKFEVINTFEWAEELNILESTTRGMYDLELREGFTDFSVWKWNGTRYQKSYIRELVMTPYRSYWKTVPVGNRS